MTRGKKSPRFAHLNRPGFVGGSFFSRERALGIPERVNDYIEARLADQNKKGEPIDPRATGGAPVSKRRGGDSNSRGLAPCRFSRPVPSTARPPLHSTQRGILPFYRPPRHYQVANRLQTGRCAASAYIFGCGLGGATAA